MKEKILLLGSGGHCHAVIDVIESEKKFEIAGIVDNQKSIGEEVLGYKVIGCDDDLQELRKNYRYAFVAVGQLKTSAVRVGLFEKLRELDFILPSIVSPLAYVSKYAEIEDGTIIMHQALINAKARIGKNCIINSKALIEHDALVEDFCHISTGAIVNGGVVVKEGSFYGSNATSKEYIEISGFVKAGSVSV